VTAEGSRAGLSAVALAKADDGVAKRDTARALATAAADLGRELGLATTLFQIAIALGGVCLVVKKRWLWYASLALGALAAVQPLKVLLLR